MAKRDYDRRLVMIGVRLFRGDVDAAKRIAKRIGQPYQVWVRERVHEAVEHASRAPPEGVVR